MLSAYIDPGKHFCGITCADHEKLYWVGYWSPKHNVASYSSVTRVVVEMPNAAFSKVPPQDLVDIAARGHWVAGKCFPIAELVQLYPNQWKGTVDGDVMTKRIISRLSPEEKVLLKRLDCADSLLHNCVDSVGMWLKEVGRL